VAGLAAVVASRPSTYLVQRSIVDQAPGPALAEAVADFHRFGHWSPWASLDPAIKTTFAGTTGAVGSSYAWVGNDKVGEGRMTITALQPARRIDVRLEFIKPFADVAETAYSFDEVGPGTRVTWSMRGESGFVGKAMGLVKSMDQLIGPDFDRGLASLKRTAEDGSLFR
jgi:hypothetical protein